ncbi:MAG: S-layer homology domain-containing protein [Clostridia bacterium]|nr:S-layer homology domain-containing protein [Clostridia bacterium]
MKKCIAFLVLLCLLLACIPVFADEAPVDDGMIHDPLSGYVSVKGNWTFSSRLKGPMADAPHSMWIAGAGEEATVTYYPGITKAGNVRVQLYLLYWNKYQTTDVLYEVHHNGKVDSFHIDLSAVEKDGWRDIGTFDFSGNPEEEFVRLICQGVGDEMTNNRASTVAFEALNEAGEIEKTYYVSPQMSADVLLNAAKSFFAPMDNFDDMTEHWANYDVEYMASKGMVQGVAEKTFDPEAQITRAEYITILDRAMGYELITGESYTDIPSDAWYATYVATAKANGLLNGLPTEDGFKPDQPITREEMALITCNAIRAIGKNDQWVETMPEKWDTFTDTETVSEWAKESLQYMVQAGLIQGVSDTLIAPQETATRAQATVILKRFMEMCVWSGPPADEDWVLTFNDEFNGDSLDWSVWTSMSGLRGAYSRWPENAVVKDGALHLMILKGTPEQQAAWTSGSVYVRHEVFRQAYGYWEARFKLPKVPTVNNSFWVHSGFVPETAEDETLKFEFDINEGKFPNLVDVTYHHYKNGHERDFIEYKAKYDLSADYHTYALKWTPEEVIFYFDGEELLRADNLEHLPVFPFLSNAVPGGLAESENFPIEGQAQVVDYVRVWQMPEYAENPEFTRHGKIVEGLKATDPYPSEVLQ